jgi:hypothetical protein
VLEHGRIVAQGDHDELLEQSELYREIVAGTSSAARANAVEPVQLLTANALGEPDAGGRL